MKSHSLCDDGGLTTDTGAVGDADVGILILNIMRSPLYPVSHLQLHPEQVSRDLRVEGCTISV